MGFKLAGNAAMESGRFEQEETHIVESLLPHVDTVINVGANIGYYCCLALQQGKYVVAFEPVAHNLGYLCRNVKANHWESRAEIYPVALSDQVGVIEIYGGGTGASLMKGWAGTSSEYRTLVPCSTLDKVLGARFQDQKCLMIVDVEGAEQMMLAGAAAFVARDVKPLWMVEISVTEHLPVGLEINPNLLSTFEIFWSQGYEAWTVDAECRIVLRSELEKIVETGIDTIRTHNFLFLEQGRKQELLGAA
ncbi:FkbM family methyltransferase [Candidatus Laterigemmans baculatus]|uniref:FkbM family methyltransferase n=1 Tax=Candidatus Laterigemmans baculatus TaxID=2770505 RepID=UPI0013D9ADE2|nr:FkbM family methyltransferase [Candidatus Laterigemmans baculatus]